MVPATDLTFFTDSAAAAGALIGLLFVAISLRTDSIFGDDAPASGRSLAGSAFTALVNAFFVSLMATIPNINLGIVAIVLALVGLYNTVRLHRTSAHSGRRSVVLVGSVVAYLLQFVTGAWLVADPNRASLVDTLCYVVIGSFAVALARAWALLQGRHVRAEAHGEAPVGEVE